MNLLDTALAREIKLMQASPDKPIAHRWTCTIHANGKDYPAMYVDAVDTVRNYIENFTDERSVVCTYTSGTFDYDILPYKNNLEVTLIKTPLTSSLLANENKHNQIETYRFIGILYNSTSNVISGNTPTGLTKSIGDRTALKTVKIMLLDKVSDSIRMQTVGGIFRGANGAEIVRTVLGKYSRLAMSDGVNDIKGVDIAPGFNTKVAEHVVIPHLTRLVDFPKMVDRLYGGIYGAGFGFYLQNRLWYIYPPYDLTRYTRTAKTLTIVNIPNNQMPHPEISYRETPAQIIVIATGAVKHIDKSLTHQLNEGNGTRFLDGSKLFHQFVEVAGNRAITQRARTTSEFLSIARETGLNMIQESVKRITTHYQAEFSKLAQRSGSYVQIEWQNAKDSLIYPGMPVKYVYIANGIPQTIYGTVVGCDTHDTTTNQDMKNKRFVSTSAITIFVDQLTSTPKEI